MDVNLVTVLSEEADMQRIRRSEQQLRAYQADETDAVVHADVVLGETIVETLVEMTGDHELTVLGATEQSTLRQFLSGTIPTGLAKRGKNPLLLVDSATNV